MPALCYIHATHCACGAREERHMFLRKNPYVFDLRVGGERVREKGRQRAVERRLARIAELGLKPRDEIILGRVRGILESIDEKGNLIVRVGRATSTWDPENVRKR